jgi:hypothetical protein
MTSIYLARWVCSNKNKAGRSDRLLQGLRGVGLSVVLGLGGCGYSLQTSQNPYRADDVEKVFVRHLDNHSAQPGVEDLVYNGIIRSLLASGKLRVVAREAEADATLSGSVDSAQFTVSNLQQIQNLQPILGQYFSSDSKRAMIPAIGVAQNYSAVLACTFLLKRTHTKMTQNPTLWSGSFATSKVFPSANQLDVPGTTSSLINQSEFERALSDMVVTLMANVHESMFLKF